jgi:hypothetical protein
LLNLHAACEAQTRFVHALRLLLACYRPSCTITKSDVLIIWDAKAKTYRLTHRKIGPDQPVSRFVQAPCLAIWRGDSGALQCRHSPTAARRFSCSQSEKGGAMRQSPSPGRNAPNGVKAHLGSNAGFIIAIQQPGTVARSV